MTLPTFIAIGPGKTGTTWLYKCLEEHPQVRLARHTKETFFFNQYYDRGMAWYEKFFEGFENAKAIGEVSNHYFFSEEAAERIARDVPGAKLICTLRSPIDRLVSSYLFSLRHARVHGNIEETILERPRMVARNFYDEFLEGYLRRFPREQILVVLYDDIRSKPEEVLQQIYAFIGVDAAFRPSVMKERIIAASVPRITALSRILKPFARWLRNHDFHRFLTWAKLSPLVLGMVTKPVASGDKPRLKPETRNYLREVYRPHIARVAAMIGRDLSAWNE